MAERRYVISPKTCIFSNCKRFLGLEVQELIFFLLSGSVNPIVRSVLACRVVFTIRTLSAKGQVESLLAGGHSTEVSEIRFR